MVTSPLSASSASGVTRRSSSHLSLVERPAAFMIPPARASWSDVDIRKGMYSNDVLSDGTAVVAGIGERIMEELTALAIRHDEECGHDAFCKTISLDVGPSRPDW